MTKKIVGDISNILESEYGYKVFRAHDTIPGGENWRNELKENLRKCEGLIAYVTEHFLRSSYANARDREMIIREHKHTLSKAERYKEIYVKT